MLSDFLIIGAQKAGSTFVHKCVKEHPTIFMPEREVPFFENPDYLSKNIEQLEQLFNGVTKEKIIGIKRPNYLAKSECPERIYSHLPNAKLIVVLRNPIERAVSAYFHQMKNGFLPINNIEKGMNEIINGEYKDLYPRSNEIIEFGFYYKSLKRYLKLFNKNQILLLLYKDIKEDPIKEIKKIYNFLGVDENYFPSSLNRTPKSSIYSDIRIKLHNFKNKFIYKYNKDNTRLYKKSMTLCDKIIVGLISLFDKLIFSNFFNNNRPKLSYQLRKKIFDLYEEDINKLEKLLGRELTHWKVYGIEGNYYLLVIEECG